METDGEAVPEQPELAEAVPQEGGPNGAGNDRVANGGAGAARVAHSLRADRAGDALQVAGTNAAVYSTAGLAEGVGVHLVPGASNRANAAVADEYAAVLGITG